jgi:hypothetical protein
MWASGMYKCGSGHHWKIVNASFSLLHVILGATLTTSRLGKRLHLSIPHSATVTVTTVQFLPSFLRALMHVLIER